MKIIVIGDRSSKKLKYISDAVVIAALEKHISCEPMDISDVRIDPSRASSPEYIRSFSQLLREEGADAVLCTTQGGMKLMSALRALEGSSPLICCIISDYSFSAEQFEHTADCYFVPHEEIRSRLIGQGISGDKIFVTGIPVKKNFRERIGKAAARNYLVIPRDRRIYLIIPDGLRAEDIAHLCKELSQSEREDHAVYIPTKRSSPDRDRLIELIGNDPHIRLITYTKQLNLYIESADAILLRPDSLTSTEAAVTGVPIVHLSLHSNDKTDGDFFASHEMAVIGRSIRDTAAKAKRFVEEKAMAARVIQMQYRNISSDAADMIIDIILGMKNRIAKA